MIPSCTLCTLAEIEVRKLRAQLDVERADKAALQRELAKVGAVDRLAERARLAQRRVAAERALRESEEDYAAERNEAIRWAAQARQLRREVARLTDLLLQNGVRP